MGLVCSTCGHQQAVYACKCNGEINQLGECCILKHLRNSSHHHEQLPLEHSFQLRKSESNDVSSEDSAYISELTDSMLEYKHTLREYRNSIIYFKGKAIKAVESSVEKSLSLLNIIEFDFVKRSMNLEDLINTNHPEGKNILERFKKQKLTGVLDRFPTTVFIPEEEILQTIRNGISILDPTSIRDRSKITTVKAIGDKLDKLLQEFQTFEKHSINDSYESSKVIELLNRQIAYERTEFKIIKEKNTLEIAEKDRQIQDCRDLLTEFKNQIAQKEELYVKERIEYIKQINDLKDHALEAKKTLIQDNSKYETELGDRNRLIKQYQKDLSEIRDKLEKEHGKLFGIIEGQDGEIKKLKSIIEQLKFEHEKALKDCKKELDAKCNLKASNEALELKIKKMNKLRETIKELKIKLSSKEAWYENLLEDKCAEILDVKETLSRFKNEFKAQQEKYCTEIWRIETNLIDGCYRFRNKEKDQALIAKLFL